MAQNIIGLLFEIAADPTKAEAAMAEFKASQAAEATELSSVWSGAMNAITGPAGIALGAIAGIGGGMMEMANKAAEAGAKIFEASERTGLAVTNLSGLAALSKETGESFDSLSLGLARAGRNLEAAIIEPGAITAKVLAQVMGGSQQLAALGLKPMDDALQTVLHRIFELNSTGERNLALSALFGRSWMTNVETLKILAEQGYGPAIEQAKKFGMFFDAKAAADAKAFTVEISQLKGEISGLALTLGRELLPRFTEWLAELHTVGYEVQLLEIGLKAQSLSLLNVGGIFDKQLGKLAAQATDVFTAEHQALAQYKQEIAALAKASESTDTAALSTQRAIKAAKEHAAALTEDEKAAERGRQAMEALGRQMDELQERVTRHAYMSAFGASAAFKAPGAPGAGVMPGMPVDQMLSQVPQWKSGFQEMLESVQNWEKITAASVGNVSLSLKSLEAIGGGTFERMGQAMAQNVTQAIVYGASIGESMERAAKAVLASIATQAYVQAIYSFALAALRAAQWDFPAAAEAAEAGGLFLLAGAATSVAGSAIPGGGSGGGRQASSRYSSGAGSGGGGEAQPGGGISTALATSTQGAPSSGNVTIAIMGKEDVANWTAAILTEGVTQRGVQLVSTSSQRGAPVGH